MTSPVIRPYQASDAEACAGIFERAWAAGHPYAPRCVDRAEFERQVAGRVVLVAEASSAPPPVGFVGVYLPDRFVHHLYVEPGAIGRGIGAALLKQALGLADGRFTLKCQLRNPRALAFYRREGWEEGERGEADGEPWVRMLSPEPR